MDLSGKKFCTWGSPRQPETNVPHTEFCHFLAEESAQEKSSCISFFLHTMTDGRPWGWGVQMEHLLCQGRWSASEAQIYLYRYVSEEPVFVSQCTLSETLGIHCAHNGSPSNTSSNQISRQQNKWSLPKATVGHWGSAIIQRLSECWSQGHCNSNMNPAINTETKPVAFWCYLPNRSYAIAKIT